MLGDLRPLLDEHVRDVEKIASNLLPFHEARENTYKLSFARRGESGVFHNLARKYDRIDGLFDWEGNGGVTLVDTLVDNAIYSLKWLAVIKQLRPQDLERWLKEVYCPDTTMPLEDAMRLFGLD